MAVYLTMDDSDLQAFVARVTANMQQLVDEVAEEVSEQVAREAGKRSSRLGEEWPISGSGVTTRKVNAPEWWAHFLSGGTQAHGPNSAQALVFNIAGGVVYAQFVSGITADPFDERGTAAAGGKVDEIVERLIGGGP